MNWLQLMNVVSAILFLIAIHIFFAAPTLPRFGKWLYDWQALVAGFLALAGAYWALMGVREQIATSEQHERRRLLRQHNAARATFPLTLAGMIEPIRAIALGLHACLPQVREEGYTSKFRPPNVPVCCIDELKASIAVTDRPEIILLISKIIQDIQILWSSVQLLSDVQEQKTWSNLDQEIEKWILKSGKIHAMIESLFSYARYECENGPSEVACGRVEWLIMNLNIGSDSIRDQIKDGFNRSPSFWAVDSEPNRSAFPSSLSPNP